MCNIKTNDTTGAFVADRLLVTYTNDIPADADFILVQIGTNDAGDWWKRDETADPPVEDTDMSTNTFKGCWNNLLIGLKKTYPTAKIGIILPNNWGVNTGSNTTAIIRNQRVADMSSWQKLQCHRLNIPVFDPVMDTQGLIFNAQTYPATANLSDVDLSWYDRTKQEMGTLQAWQDQKSNTWWTNAQYIYDNVHTTEKGSLLLSYFYEQWMKTVLMAN